MSGTYALKKSASSAFNINYVHGCRENRQFELDSFKNVFKNYRLFLHNSVNKISVKRMFISSKKYECTSYSKILFILVKSSYK